MLLGGDVPFIIVYLKRGIKMISFMLSAGKCPRCGEGTYWQGLGFDYNTYERISWCDSCGYEKRVFDQEAKEVFEFLERAVRGGKIGKSIRVSTKRREE